MIDKAGLEAIANGNGKFSLPPVPDHDDPIGLRAWLTAAFNLNPKHPIKDGRRLGDIGPRGHIVFRRVDAPEIRFEPITQLGEPRQLVSILNTYSWRSTD